MKKWAVAIAALAGVGLLGWQIYQKVTAAGNTSDRRGRNAPVAVEIAEVRTATVREEGNFSGSLYPLSEFVLAPKIAGRLEKILVHIGDTVTGGQLVAELDDDEYRQEVSQAAAELEVARANLQERTNALENAKREYDRTVALREKKIASESELDAAASEYNAQQAKQKVAVAQVAQKEAELKVAEVRLSYTRIKVPANNVESHRVVGERFVDEGAMLAPNTPIVSVIAIERLVAAIYVIERDYPKIRPGLAAEVTTDAYPGQTFTGRVVRIAPLLKEKSREARVEIEIPNEGMLLKPGMFVRVRIRFGEHENARVVPAAAIVKRSGSEGVFLVDLQTKTVRFVPVTVGIVNGNQAEVLEPPLSGAVVILGQHLLEEGSPIIVASQKPAGAAQ